MAYGEVIGLMLLGLTQTPFLIVDKGRYSSFLWRAIKTKYSHYFLVDEGCVPYILGETLYSFG